MNVPWSRVGYKAQKIVHEITCSHKVSKASQHHNITRDQQRSQVGTVCITKYITNCRKASKGIQRCHNVLIADHTVLLCF